MSVQLHSPARMVPNTPYHHVAIAKGQRQVFIAGQVAHMPNGEPVPALLGDQTAQALRNIHTGLTAAGATFHDVVRLTVYVVNWSADLMPELMRGIEEAAQELGLPLPMPPASLIGVQALFEPDILVEIEATAVC